MSLSRGDRLGRYEIVAPLGAGGMGEIFRARDTELGREVAVKVLPADVAADPSRIDRFQREAQALAALSHPNLLEVYDVGSSNGVQYVVTELLEGQTLRERVPSGGLPWQKVAEMGAAMAEGLAAAHSRGIVHRDLKPENIFITADGRVKILDFGLAKVVEAAEPEAETGTLTPAGTAVGTILGTLGYMSPEQVKGQPADHRSDIFALGCVLYEMVSGRRAFASDTTAEIIAAVLKEEPPQLSSTGAALPVDLERSIHRCLEKEPAARFQSAADLGFALRSIGSGPTRPAMATPSGDVAVRSGRSRWWIALAAALGIVAVGLLVWWQLARDVRPVAQVPTEATVAAEEKVVVVSERRVFVENVENRTGDPSLDPLAAGITAMLRDVLEQSDIAISPNSELDEARTRAQAPEVAGLVVTGSIGGRGDDVEATVRAVDLESGRTLWASQPVRSGRSAGADALGVAVSRAASATHLWFVDVFPLEHLSHVPVYEVFRLFAGPPTTDPFEYYAGFSQYLGQALERDPGFVPAVYMLGVGCRMNVSDRLGLETVIHAIEAAREHNSDMTDHEARALKATTAFFKGDMVTAFDLVRQNQEQAPRNTWWRHERALLAVSLNALSDVVATVEAIDFDSMDEHPPMWAGGLYMWLLKAYGGLGEYDKLLELGERLRANNPTELPADILTALAGLERFDELDQELTALESRPGGDIGIAIGIIVEASEFLATLGHDDKAAEVAERALRLIDTIPPEDSTPGIAWSRLTALGVAGRWQEVDTGAREVIADPATSERARGYARFRLGMAAAHLGRTDEARALLAEYQSEREWRKATAVAAHLGELDLAVDHFRRALAAGQQDYSETRNLNYVPLFGYPPWEELIKPR